MNDDLISGELINRLAWMLHCMRPTWTEPGIAAALVKAKALPQCLNLSTFVVAAVKAAFDEKNRTPAVIAMDGAHWHQTPKDIGTYYGPLMCSGCGEHGHEHQDCWMRAGQTTPPPEYFAEIRRRNSEDWDRKYRPTHPGVPVCCECGNSDHTDPELCPWPARAWSA